jgi:hypothetical protein
MPIFKIEATRETVYEFEIEAETMEEAEDQIRQIELTDEVENYAYDWYPLDITSIEEEE